MDKKQIALIAIGLSLITTFGCSSAEKKAAELMENGSFEEAELAYENIVKDDPQNTEAQAALQKARIKVIDTRLIDIRKRRMSGSSTSAPLVDILTLENRWKIQPPGPAAFTQHEELDFATDALLKEFKNPKFSKLPLKREFDLRQVESLFQISHSEEYKKLRSQISADGKSMCLEYSKAIKPDLIYISIFTKKFCNFWKVNSAFKIENKYLDKPLFKEVTLTANLEGFPQEALHDLLTRLNSSFKSTPWYSASGNQNLNLLFQGHWTSDLQRNTTQLLHQYDVQESYVESVLVTKTRQVPKTTTNIVYDPLTQSSTPITTTDYVTESYTEYEPQTQWHTVQKTYPYGGWQLHQSLKLNLEGSGSISGHPLQLALNDESHADDTESDASYPSIGLYPKKATLIQNPSQWLESNEQQISEQLQEKASGAWVDLFCSESTIDSYARSGERVHRCLRLESAMAHPQKFVEEWHQKFLGLSAEDTASLLKAAN